MGLILLILKIILIAFLIVLGLIVLLLGILLFVPIRYEVSGSIGDSREIQIKGKVTYFLSIIKLLLFYKEEQFDMKLFFFGCEKKLKKEEQEEEEETETSTSPEDTQECAHMERTQSETKEASKDIPEPTLQKETETKTSEKPAKSKKKKEKKQKSSFDFAFIKQQLTDEHNQSVVRKIWAELLYLLKHFKFRKIVTDLVFATGDPSTTGQALGVLCMIPVLYRYDFKIIPDFEAEDAYVKGTFLVAGKVRLIHILVTLLRLIFDKEVRLVAKRILVLLEQ